MTNCRGSETKRAPELWLVDQVAFSYQKAIVDDEPLNFEEHRHRREENASTVRCARCGKWIVATATQCPECGVHFKGEAQEFTHPSEDEGVRAGAPGWMVVLAVLLLAALAVGLLVAR